MGEMTYAASGINASKLWDIVVMNNVLFTIL